MMGFKWVVFVLRATRKLLMMLRVHHRVLRRHLVFQHAITLERAMGKKNTLGLLFGCVSVLENILNEKENIWTKNIKDSLARNNKDTSINQLDHRACTPSCVCIKGLLSTRIVL